MKTPPKQYTDPVALKMVQDFIRGTDMQDFSSGIKKKPKKKK